MPSTRIFVTSAVAASALFSAIPAFGGPPPILRFHFDELNGNYNSMTQSFNAHSDNILGLHTSGHVDRIQDPASSASFGPGLATSMVTIDLSVLNLTAYHADGSGTFSILDTDGDNLTGDMVGAWITTGGGGTYFQGILSNVAFVEGGAVDPDYNGPAGGSFSKDFSPNVPPFDGLVVQILINPSQGFFDADYNSLATTIDALAVPAPGSVTLLGGAALLLARRRRA